MHLFHIPFLYISFSVKIGGNVICRLRSYLRSLIAETVEIGARRRIGSATTWNVAAWCTTRSDDIPFVSSGASNMRLMNQPSSKAVRIVRVPTRTTTSSYDLVTSFPAFRPTPLSCGSYGAGRPRFVGGFAAVRAAKGCPRATNVIVCQSCKQTGFLATGDAARFARIAPSPTALLPP